MRLALIAFGLLLASPAAAALPPLYDSLVHLRVVLDGAEAAEISSGRPIQSIEALGEDEAGNPQWLVGVGDCEFTVTLRPLPLPEGMVGRVDYEVSDVTSCEPYAEE